MKASNWIDYDGLREQLTFERVLEHYGVTVEPVDGNEAGQCKSVCPLPQHKGERTRKQFSIHLTKKMFQCFGCKAKGSILDFVVLMEKEDPLDVGAFRRVLLTASEQLLAASSETSRVKEEIGEKSPEVKGLPTLVNAPLDFELKLDPEHESLAKLGLKPETIREFGLGYAPRGRLKGRIAAPLRDVDGELIGYAGYGPGQEPDYLYPDGERVHEERRLVFDRGAFLYQAHRLEQGGQDLLVVTPNLAEVWQLHQAGIPGVVALMGDAISKAQQALIEQLVNATGGYVVMAVPEGWTLETSSWLRLTRTRFGRHVPIPELISEWESIREIAG